MSGEDDYYDALLRAKYAHGTETGADDVRQRVAQALAAVELPAERTARAAEFLALMRAGFCPGGRIMAAAGLNGDASLVSCFVQPLAEHDDAAHGAPGLFTALREAVETLRRGGGVGYDFSPLHPVAACDGATGGGPLAALRLFDAACATLAGRGARRGAQMGVLRVDHPDIAAFVAAKDIRAPLAELAALSLRGAAFEDHAQRLRRLGTFNLSVAVSDAFMEQRERGGSIDLVHAAEPDRHIVPGARRRDDGLWVYDRIDARALWARIVDTAWGTAGPGLLFIDRINADDNLYGLETLAATNPCGEQPLPAYGSCCLGSFNLAAFVREPFGERAAFDWAALRRLVAPAVRLLDNVLDATRWPLAQQHDEARATRRVGLGFTGLASALAMLRLRYDATAAVDFASQVARTLRDHAYEASVNLAEERGPFPRFAAERYLARPFVQRLPEPLRAAIRRHGLRNSHLLCIAPAGSISLAFGRNVSSGIEPAFDRDYLRRTRAADGSIREHRVQDYAWRRWLAAGGDPRQVPDWFATSRDIGAAAQLRMQAAVQPYVDASIAKTVNLPAEVGRETVQDAYELAWTLGCKGCSVWRPNAVTGAVLQATADGNEPGGCRPAPFCPA